MTPSPEAPVQPQGWFQRNWKWLIPVGCGLPMLCCGVIGAATFFGATTAMKSSEVYAEALSKALTNPEVRAALGEPITPGLMPQGSVQTKNGVGTASLRSSLEGPKGKATLTLEAKKTGDRWIYSELRVDVGSKRIDLLGSGPTDAPELPPIPEELDAEEPPAEPDEPPPDDQGRAE